MQFVVAASSRRTEPPLQALAVGCASGRTAGYHDRSWRRRGQTAGSRYVLSVVAGAAFAVEAEGQGCAVGGLRRGLLCRWARPLCGKGEVADAVISAFAMLIATSRLHKQQPRRGRGQPPPRPKGRARRSSAWGVAWRHRESGLVAPPSVGGRCACRPWAVVTTTVHGTKLRPVLVARAGVSSRSCWISALQEESRRRCHGRVGAKGLRRRDQPGAASHR